MAWLRDNHERLRLYRLGDERTLGRTYRYYAPRLLARLASVGIQHHIEAPFELADVVQEVFIRAFSEPARSQYDGQRTFYAYLVGIMGHVVVDQQRKSTRRSSLWARFGDLVFASRGNPRQEQSALDAELRQLYDRFLAKLSDADRTLVQERFVNNTSRRAVCAKVNLTAAQLRIREHQLRRQLFTLFLGAGYSSQAAHHAVLLLLLVGIP